MESKLKQLLTVGWVNRN